jgi:esterase/lipase superfamily enzyme
MYQPNKRLHRRFTILIFLTCILLLFSANLWAYPVVFLLDTSGSMSDTCTPTQASYLSVAQKFLESEVNRGRVVRVSKGTLYSFDSASTLRISLTRNASDIVAGSQLKPQGNRGELSQVLDDLQQQAGIASITKARLIIVTRARKSDLTPSLTKSIKSLTNQGWDVEFVQIGPGSTKELKSYFGAVRTIACQPTETQEPKIHEAGLENQILREATDMLGMTPGELRVTSDFISDLQIDRMFAYDVMARLCARHAVVAPLRDDLTTVAKIADYIASAPEESSNDITVRGDKKAGLATKEPIEVRTVFFGTNRAQTGHSDPSDYFSGDRAALGKISYGQCEVSIPVTVHQRGVMESPPMGLEMLADPRKHIILKHISVLNKDAFFRQIKASLNQGKGRSPQGEDILIFIHGYNVQFEEAARRTAQISYDLEFDGVPVFFSWPSDGKLYAYVSDREDVEWSVPHVRDFLLDIVNTAGSRRVHLLTHSMGHEGMLRALNLIALSQQSTGRKTLFENIIMAAPDFDAQIFSEQLVGNISHLSNQWTLYASDKDMALNVSASLRFADRLGLPLTVVRDVVTVDATGVEVTPWSVPEFHSYFATKQRVIDDIIAVLKGKEPTQRPIQKNSKGKLPYWKLLMPNSH